MRSLTDLDWRQVTLRNIEPKPSKRWGHRCLLIAHEMVLFGGFDGMTDNYSANFMNDLWVFDTLTLLWRLVHVEGDEISKRSNFSMCYDEVHERVVVYGGKLPDKKSCNYVWVLDWRSKHWLQLPCNSVMQPEERKYHIAELIYPHMLVFGGESSTDLDDLWLYNMITMSWTEMRPEGVKPRARRFHSSALVGNWLYVIGGCFNKYEQLGDIWGMDLQPLLRSCPQQLKWKDLTNTFSGSYLPRWGHSSTAKDDKIYVFGGKATAPEGNDVYTIDLTHKTITAMGTTNVPTSRRRHSAVFVGATMLVFGGFNVEYFDHLYYLTLKERPFQKRYSTPQAEMEELVDSGRFNSTVLTTADKYRLYVHLPIIKRKLGHSTEQFLEQLQQVSSKEAVRQLKRVYGMVNFSEKNHLPITEDTIPAWKSLLEICGIADQPAEMAKQGFIALSESQLNQLDKRSMMAEYTDINDLLTITGEHETFSTSAMLASLRSSYFSNLTSVDFSEFRTHSLHAVRPSIFRIVLRFIEFDWVVVPHKFEAFDWMELLLAARYYGLDRLAAICETRIQDLLNESNIQRIFELAVRHDIKTLICVSAQMLVIQEALEGRDKPIPRSTQTSSKLQQKLQRIKSHTRNQLSFYIGQLLVENQRDNPEKLAASDFHNS